MGGGQEDALGVIFFWINQTHFLQCLLLSLVCWLWDSIWIIVTLTLASCFSSLFSSLYTYTYTYTYCYYYCILYFLVLTKPALAWVPVKASFSTSDTIVTLYRHRSTNRFVSLVHPLEVWNDLELGLAAWAVLKVVSNFVIAPPSMIHEPLKSKRGFLLLLLRLGY